DSSRGRALGVLSDLQAERPSDPELISLRARTLFILGRREEADQALKALDALGVKDARLAVMSAAARQLDR
ncbi:MAG: serine/threonine protein kinase, partial [Planctomycetota bacterium]|nr:serine/threonine protein kinase [Planctomycetota bacterium]